jgi:hypothetical protein
MNLSGMKYAKNADKYKMCNSPSMITAAKYQGWNELDMQIKREKQKNAYILVGNLLKCSHLKDTVEGDYGDMNWTELAQDYVQWY